MENQHRPKIGKPTCWQRRTRLEKFFIIVVILAAIVIIVLAAVLGSQSKAPDICTTPQCVSTAARVMRYMNISAKPCDDFYEFACGGYLERTQISDSRTTEDSFSKITREVENQIRKVLEEPIDENEVKSNKLIKSLYQACMNKENIDKNSRSSLKDVLTKTGGWPVLGHWNANTFDWVNTTQQLRRLGITHNIFLTFQVDADDRNSSKRILTIDQPSISFETIKRAGNKSDPILMATLKYMIAVASDLGAENDHVLAADLEKVLEMDIDLAKICIPSEERRDISEEYNPMTIAELERNYSSIKWLDLINAIVSPSTLTYDDVVVVFVPKYIQKLEDLLTNTDKKVIANYMYWKVVASTMPYMDDKFRQSLLDFQKVTIGVTSREQRSQECTNIALQLELAGGVLYVRKYFNEDAKKNTIDIVENIQTELKSTIQKVDWMDKTTKGFALEKIEDLGKHIGYPDELLEDSKIEEYYKNLEVNSSDYLEAALNITRFLLERQGLLLDVPVNKLDWTQHSMVAVVNAFYDLNENSIQVPAGILQDVFFNNDNPKYMNYGGIGYVIGHEMTHGFDDQGRQYDKTGTLMDWWEPKTEESYNKKAQCIIDQYSREIVPEINLPLNGINTQGENIADNGGAKQAYLAYQRWVKKNSPEPKLPGLDYTPSQMFWISLGNAWCAKVKAKALKLKVLSYEHAPDNYRVTIPLANSKFFAQDFKCPPGSKMNPHDTCTVW